MARLIRVLLVFLLAALGTTLPRVVLADPPVIGIVVMHGKGSSPNGPVSGLASALAAKGYLVANLEMPWSGRRGYDVGVSAAEAEVEAALAGLRDKGAQKLFVAGHSQGGVFAIHFATGHALDGVIAITPGGSVGSKVFREKLGASMARARAAVAAGKGEDVMEFLDHEGSRGTWPVHAKAAVYLQWFDPQGAMNLARAVPMVRPQTPVLWLVAKHDYPGLRKMNIPLYQRLPANPLTVLYQPDSNHLGAPTASIDEILRWTREVANAPRH
jgi:alpha-beta hydrolase superfamily lysophospholipase